MPSVAGIDVGGTFTDLVVFDPATGAVRLAKVPTTPDNQATGVLAVLDAAGVDPAALDLIVHGTTTTTNAVLERKLARTGLITTAGLPRHPRTRPPHPPQPLRHDRHLHPPHPPRPPPRGPRAHGRPRPHPHPPRRDVRPHRRRPPPRRRLRSPRHPLPPRLRQPRPRTARRRDRRGHLAHPLDHPRPRPAVGIPRVRARRHRRRQRLRPAHPRTLPRPPPDRAVAPEATPATSW